MVKKLNRPVRWLLPIAALTLLYGGAEIVFRLAGTSRERIDYGQMIQARQLEGRPDGPNGWFVYAEAAELTQGISEEFRKRQEALAHETDQWERSWRPDFMLIRTGELSAERFDVELEMEAALERAGVLDRLDELERYEVFARPIPADSEMISVQFPTLSTGRLLVKSRAGMLRWRMFQGEHEAATRELRRGLRVGQVCGQQPFLIDHLVAAACQQLMLTELRQTIAEFLPDEALARTWAALVDEPLALDVELALESERCMVLDVVQRSFTDNGHGNGVLSTDRFFEMQSGMWNGGGVSDVLPSFWHANRARTEEAVNALYDGVLVNVRTPADQLPPFDSTEFLYELGPRFQLLQMMAPSFGRVTNAGDRIATERRGTRVMLALAIWRARHGRYPATVDDALDLLDPPADATSMGFVVQPDGSSYQLFWGEPGDEAPEDPRDRRLLNPARDEEPE